MPKKEREWVVGILFLQIPEVKEKRITKNRVLKLLKGVETADIKFLIAIKPDIIIFIKQKGVPNKEVRRLAEVALKTEYRGINSYVFSYVTIKKAYKVAKDIHYKLISKRADINKK